MIPDEYIDLGQEQGHDPELLRAIRSIPLHETSWSAVGTTKTLYRLIRHKLRDRLPYNEGYESHTIMSLLSGVQSRLKASPIESWVDPTEKLSRPSRPAPTGWCSWHAFGTQISESIIMAQAREAVRLGLGLKCILIDDGWCSHWGDWLSPDPQKFPDGIAHVVRELKAMGLDVGLWWAPLMATESSTLYREHPDWFISDLEGTKSTVFDMMIRNKRRVLDYQNPSVRAYLDTCMREFESWGVTLMKNDFLYAGHFDEHLTDDHIPNSNLRHLLKDVQAHGFYSIACGCPLRPAVGVVDAMRISYDINIPHLRKFPPINRLMVRVYLDQLSQNSRARGYTSEYWRLDPDAFVTDPDLGISARGRLNLLKIIRDCGGVRFLGDDLTRLTPESRSLIKQFLDPSTPEHSSQDGSYTPLDHTATLMPEPAMAS